MNSLYLNLDHGIPQSRLFGNVLLHYVLIPDSLDVDNNYNAI